MSRTASDKEYKGPTPMTAKATSTSLLAPRGGAFPCIPSGFMA